MPLNPRAFESVRKNIESVKRNFETMDKIEALASGEGFACLGTVGRMRRYNPEQDAGKETHICAGG
jgi:hypothetical protein